MTDSAERGAAIAASLTDDATYADPRSQGRLIGHDAISDYVGMFSANAPGWTATVVSYDEVGGFQRGKVAFGGAGPDGKDMVQHGTYFGETDESGKLMLLVGFAGE